MKKILGILVLGLFFFINANAEERKSKLDKLFIQLKNTKNLSSAKIIENKNVLIQYRFVNCKKYNSYKINEYFR